MSSSLIREPAWTGLAPGLPEAVALAPEDARRLLTELRVEGRLTGLRFGGKAASQFLLEQPSAPPAFLKLVAPAQRVSAERAEAIAHWIAGKELRVAAPVEGFPRLLPDGRLAVATAYIAGRRLMPVEAELHALGRATGRLHGALSAHPDRPGWTAATAERMASLSSVRSDLASGRLRGGPWPDRLAALAADPDLDFVLPEATATPLHGDLNPGNVLLDPQSGEAVLLDFEDVFHSVLPPAFELLLMIERFVLVPIPADDAAVRLARSLLSGYRPDSGGAPLDLGGRRPSDVLRSLSLRSLCVLALGERSGVMIASDEWRKFFALEQSAQQRAAALDRLFADGEP